MLARKPRALGVAVFAALALAASATGAQAEPRFEADKYKATIEGTATAQSVFTFGGIYQFACKKAKFQGELFVSTAALTLAPTYEECTWEPPITEPIEKYVVQVTMNGCDYRFHGLEFLAKDEYRAIADLECPAGKQVVIDLFHKTTQICTLTVPAQANKSDLKLIDQTGKEETADDDVKAQITVEKMRFTQDLFACPVKQGTYENLQYLGESTLVATNEGKQIGFRVSGE